MTEPKTDRFANLVASCKIVNEVDKSIKDLHEEKFAYLSNRRIMSILWFIPVITFITLLCIVYFSGPYNFNEDLGITIPGGIAIILFLTLWYLTSKNNGNINQINKHITDCVSSAKDTDPKYVEPEWNNPDLSQSLKHIWNRFTKKSDTSKIYVVNGDNNDDNKPEE